MVADVDVAIVSTYVLLMLLWGLYVGLRQDSDDFFVFSRKAPFLLVLFSLISTWVGSGTTVAVASSGYSTGISLGLTAGIGGLVGVFSASFFVPRLKEFGDRYEAHTLADFYSIRYSDRSRFLAAGFISLVYLMITASQFVGLAAVLEVFTGAHFSTVISMAGITTILYTTFAGIEADFYTDAFHFLIMAFVLVFLLTPKALKDIGGLEGLSSLSASYFDPFAYGGVSFFIAGIVFGAASVFVTMELWQRAYASSTPGIAKKALITGVLGIILFYGVSTLLGMSAKIVLPGANPDQALFLLMAEYLPAGMLGLGIAGFVAVFVSTINSTLMVASATLTKDIYKGGFRKELGEEDFLKAGRLITLAFGSLSIFLAYAVRDIVTLSVNGLLMLLILFPSILMGFYWQESTSKAAEISIVSGILVLATFLFMQPRRAFVPAFIASLIAFVVTSKYSEHSTQENISIV